ncbi:hypothetical protein COSO111634_30210 [Corallococcus soli]
MAPHEELEALLQRRHVERPVQPGHDGDVVEGAARLQAVQEPQALLREGQRHGLGARHADRRGAGSRHGSRGLAHQLRDARAAQQRLHGDGRAQGLLQRVRQLHRRQRVQPVARQRRMDIQVLGAGAHPRRHPREHAGLQLRSGCPGPLLLRFPSRGLDARLRSPHVGGPFRRRCVRLRGGRLGSTPRMQLAQAAREERRARGPPLHLAAGRLRQAPWLDEHHRVGHHLVRLRQPLPDGAQQARWLAIPLARIHLLHHDEPLLAVHLDAERHAAAGPQRGVALLHHGFQVLRIQVAASQDDEVLGAARDVQLPRVQEPQVPGAQERPLSRGDARAEDPRGLLRLTPVALGHAGPLHPDLPHLARLHHPAGVRLHHEQLLRRHRRAAAHQRPGLP